jgi:hypothetical protein
MEQVLLRGEVQVTADDFAVGVALMVLLGGN